MLPTPEHPLLFFTGGTALRGLSAELALRTSSVVHVVTPFDSGGSTAQLRRVFSMPAVGDMRNRLLALADESRLPKGLLGLLASRLPETGNEREMRAILRRMAGERTLFAAFVDPIKSALESCFCAFVEAMPESFDARGACIGNLLMAGSYLQSGRSIASVVSFFSRILHVRGMVVPVVEKSLHLAGVLEDGSVLAGQHRFKDLSSPVKSLFLTVHEPRTGVCPQVPCRPFASRQALSSISAASLICYPMGSFYTSVLSNLLPDGIGRAIAKNPCPKLFIPNTGHDAELLGLTLDDEVDILIRTLKEDAPAAKDSDFLSLVCVDRENGFYFCDMDRLAGRLKERGIGLVDSSVVGPDGRFHLPVPTADLILSFCGEQIHANL